MQEAHLPIASLISKSEKAQQRLRPGSWQYTMLGENLKALRIASALMNGGGNRKDAFAPNELREALRAIAAMIGRAEQAQAKFALGAPHHTLQQNRLTALRLAEAKTAARLRDASSGLQ